MCSDKKILKIRNGYLSALLLLCPSYPSLTVEINVIYHMLNMAYVISNRVFLMWTILKLKRATLRNPLPALSFFSHLLKYWAQSIIELGKTDLMSSSTYLKTTLKNHPRFRLLSPTWFEYKQNQCFLLRHSYMAIM
jgi:hypothetical protein